MCEKSCIGGKARVAYRVGVSHFNGVYRRT